MASGATQLIPSNAWSSAENIAIPSAVFTTTTAGAKLAGFDRFTAALWFLDVTAASGTSPTCNVYIQLLAADGSTWFDIASFAQATATGQQHIAHVSSGNAVFDQSDATLTASQIRTVPFGPFVRGKVKIGGTNPSFTLALYVTCIE